MNKITLLLPLILLSSCSVLSKKDCQSMDWFEGGRIDGSQGQDSYKFVKYSEACLKHGISVDHAKYAEGRQAGLSVFCTYQNGLRNGKNGKNYQNVCPKHLETGFLKGYNLGKREHEFESKKRDLDRRERELQRREQELN